MIRGCILGRVRPEKISGRILVVSGSKGLSQRNHFRVVKAPAVPAFAWDLVKLQYLYRELSSS